MSSACPVLLTLSFFSKHDPFFQFTRSSCREYHELCTIDKNDTFMSFKSIQKVFSCWACSVLSKYTSKKIPFQLFQEDIIFDIKQNKLCFVSLVFSTLSFSSKYHIFFQITRIKNKSLLYRINCVKYPRKFIGMIRFCCSRRLCKSFLSRECSVRYKYI